jgi:hypothetical protein
MDYRKRRFFRELAMREPKLTGVIDHRNFRICRDELKELFRLCPTEAAVLLVGPTHCGKSQLLAFLVSFLEQAIYRDAGANDRPVIGLSAMTTREGRTTPKFALHELLEDVGHPFFQIEPFSTAEPLYRPAMRIDETYCLRALKSGLHSRNVRDIMVDDAHYLVRTKDEEFKASLLEALKGLVTPQTTLVLAGGYELASVAMAYRTHFAERLLVVHLPRYGGTRADAAEWRNIVATFARASKLHLVSPNLLSDMADRLRYECHGVVGILEKRLLRAQAYAAARGKRISVEVLDATRPPDVAWQTTEADILSGEKLLGTQVDVHDIPLSPVAPVAESQPSEATKAKGNGRTKKTGTVRGMHPFERAPRRALAKVHT